MFKVLLISSLNVTEKAVGRSDGYTNDDELCSFWCCDFQNVGFLLLVLEMWFWAIVAIGGMAELVLYANIVFCAQI